MDTLAVGTERLVHIDLKGAPPKVEYFEKFFPFIKEFGATGVLLEWEDTFPFTQELMPIGGLSNSAQASGAPYSQAEARQLLDFAADSQLTVIPLVQTFGHMEYVLKHDQWRSLREVDSYPSSMCPSNSATLPLIRSMIKQIVTFHKNMQYIHIGADEIWHLGLCAVCVKRAAANKHGKAALYLDHVSDVAHFIQDNYPHLKIIMWDDMLRTIDLKILQDYYLGNLVEPMVWQYGSLDTFRLGGQLWEKYGNIFTKYWGASAYKGATSSCQILPINRYHVSNHEAWLDELGQHAGKIVHFRGIALTGWSRYDHYATLCELLPSAVPSLCLCLKTWLSSGYSQDLYNNVGSMLGYNSSEENSGACTTFGSPLRMPITPQLTFPGWQIYVGFEWFVSLKARYKALIDSDQMHSWFNQWQVLNNYTNPMQIDSILPLITDLLSELTSIETYLNGHLSLMYFNHTIEELIGTLISPIKDHLKHLKSDCETQLALGCRVRGQRRLNL